MEKMRVKIVKVTQLFGLLEYLNSLYILLTKNIFFWGGGKYLTKIMIKINLTKPASQFSKENLNRFWWSIKKCFELSIKSHFLP
jgi:hypothetical protein